MLGPLHREEDLDDAPSIRPNSGYCNHWGIEQWMENLALSASPSFFVTLSLK